MLGFTDEFACLPHQLGLGCSLATCNPLPASVAVRCHSLQHSIAIISFNIIIHRQQQTATTATRLASAYRSHTSFVVDPGQIFLTSILITMQNSAAISHTATEAGGGLHVRGSKNVGGSGNLLRCGCRHRRRGAVVAADWTPLPRRRT